MTEEGDNVLCSLIRSYEMNFSQTFYSISVVKLLQWNAVIIFNCDTFNFIRGFTAKTEPEPETNVLSKYNPLQRARCQYHFSQSSNAVHEWTSCSLHANNSVHCIDLRVCETVDRNIWRAKGKCTQRYTRKIALHSLQRLIQIDWTSERANGILCRYWLETVACFSFINEFNWLMHLHATVKYWLSSRYNVINSSFIVWQIDVSQISKHCSACVFKERKEVHGRVSACMAVCPTDISSAKFMDNDVFNNWKQLFC